VLNSQSNLWEIYLANNPLREDSLNWLKARQAGGVVTSYGDHIFVSIDGLLQDYSTEEDPQNIKGSIYVPMRKIFEALHAKVTWESDTRSVVATKSNLSLKLQVGSKKVEINGAVKELDTEVQIINGSTFVPIRLVSEALGAEVKWDASKKTDVITAN
jgi:hypothetical protein